MQCQQYWLLWFVQILTSATECCTYHRDRVGLSQGYTRSILLKAQLRRKRGWNWRREIQKHPLPAWTQVHLPRRHICKERGGMLWSNTHSSKKKEFLPFKLTSREGAVDVMAALKRKLKSKTQMNTKGRQVLIKIHTHLPSSHLHTHQRVFVQQGCVISLWRTHTRGVRRVKSPIKHWQRAGTHQQLLAFLYLQARRRERGGAQVILQPPAEGGRDVEETGCTFRTPRETCLMQRECGWEPDICGICGGCKNHWNSVFNPIYYTTGSDDVR